MIAILSDIHGNYPALEAVIEKLPSTVSEIWILGDIIGELPFPREVIDILTSLSSKLPVVCIAGNREESIIDAKDGRHNEWWNGTQMRLLAWTVENLTRTHWKLIRKWPTQAFRQVALNRVVLCHGAPYETKKKILTSNDAAE